MDEMVEVTKALAECIKSTHNLYGVLIKYHNIDALKKIRDAVISIFSLYCEA